MKCASSAEADVFDQAVALVIAIISQIVRTCHLLVWWLLRTATLAFATKPLVIKATSYQGASPSQQQTFVLSKPFSGKSTSSDGEQECVGCLPANTVPISDCDSACRKMADSFPPAVTAWCSRLLHSDNLAIQKTASSCGTKPLSWPSHHAFQVNGSCSLTLLFPSIAKAYLQKKGTTTMKCASSAEADVSDQAVAFFIAVTPQTARRCDLHVWLLLRTAIIAFATWFLVSANQHRVKKHYIKSFYWYKCLLIEIVFVPLYPQMRSIESYQSPKQIVENFGLLYVTNS